VLLVIWFLLGLNTVVIVYEKLSCYIWSKAEIDAFDPKAKKHLSGPHKMEMSTQISFDTRPRFIAKVALEAGYFLFGKTFVDNADCDTLRRIIFCEDLEKQKFDFRFHDNLHSIENKDAGALGATKVLIEQMGGSSVVLGWAQDRIIISVGILGEYLGMINFKADIDKFPIRDNEFRLGHVIQCKDKLLHRDSLWHTFYRLCKKLNLDIDESKIEW